MAKYNSLAPPPHAGHQPGHTLLWDGIPFFNQLQPALFNQLDCIGHSCTMSMPKLILGRTVGRPFQLLHSQILEVVSDKPRSVGGKHCHVGGLEFSPRQWRYRIATGCTISSRYLSALKLPPMMTNLDFSSE